MDPNSVLERRTIRSPQGTAVIGAREGPPGDACGRGTHRYQSPSRSLLHGSDAQPRPSTRAAVTPSTTQHDRSTRRPAVRAARAAGEGSAGAGEGNPMFESDLLSDHSCRRRGTAAPGAIPLVTAALR